MMEVLDMIIGSMTESHPDSTSILAANFVALADVLEFVIDRGNSSDLGACISRLGIFVISLEAALNLSLHGYSSPP